MLWGTLQQWCCGKEIQGETLKIGNLKFNHSSRIY